MFRLIRTHSLRVKDCSMGFGLQLRAQPLQNFSERTKAETSLQEDHIESTRKSLNNKKALDESEIPRKKFIEKQSMEDFKNSVSGYFDESKNTLRIFETQETTQIGLTIPPAKAVQLIKSLAASKNRPVKLITALCCNINNNLDKLNLVNYADVLYSLACLSVKNKEFLDNLANAIERRKSEFTSGALPSLLLYSCGVLKYRNCELIEILLGILANPKYEKKNQGYVTALITLAQLNYNSPFINVIRKELCNCKVTDFNSTKSYLDYVWALVLLGHYPEKDITNVLSDDFVNQLSMIEDVFDCKKSLNLKLKNINGAASYIISSYTGPKLNKKFFDYQSIPPVTPFSTSVIDGLSHIFPKKDYIETNVNTNAGFFLDIECYLDSKCEPVSCRKKKDAIKTGILLVNFNDLCLDDEITLTGITNFKQKILEAKGYKVVKVFYNDYCGKSKLYEKVEYLQKKLKEVTKK